MSGLSGRPRGYIEKKFGDFGEGLNKEYAYLSFCSRFFNKNFLISLSGCSNPPKIKSPAVGAENQIIDLPFKIN